MCYGGVRFSYNRCTLRRDNDANAYVLGFRGGATRAKRAELDEKRRSVQRGSDYDSQRATFVLKTHQCLKCRLIYLAGALRRSRTRLLVGLDGRARSNRLLVSGDGLRTFVYRV